MVASGRAFYRQKKITNLITKLQIAFEAKALTILIKPDLKRRVYPLKFFHGKIKEKNHQLKPYIDITYYLLSLYNIG